MLQLARAARCLKPGATFVTLKQFPEAEAKHFDLVHQAWYKMSWGRTTVYTLRRRAKATGDRSGWMAGAGASAPPQ